MHTTAYGNMWNEKSKNVSHLQTTPLCGSSWICYQNVGASAFCGAARMWWLSQCGAIDKGMDAPGLGKALPGARAVRGSGPVCAVWSYHRRVGGRWGDEGVNVILPWETVSGPWSSNGSIFGSWSKLPSRAKVMKCSFANLPCLC